ncbi:MAG TPA: tRNA adenosine(34) deaminase TadA [Candidatus Saccharicenans sp.]|nr:tRNA adenosine(34) deaminase TadA [Candidatus Saccharicenans sp.]HOT68237.1 tRNA adenosine(34) deaminase TadA [Candidatus Saccharicenans sp.]HPC87238.1 tRNA adenosine(34) deaminase TadA [Candidatus Saccharicenans sp.]HPP23321.1 tRNA adenosine(34) deaminase TadA [Candidatus Saccharicenans sp.]HQE64488.1 tRNA adenosine(34) deaminase TadA [Candidatus Saccharicenans sp.]
MLENNNRDKYFMEKALAEANRAARRGEVPVGAVLVKGNKIVARGYNQSISRSDPAAHAEIIALRKAGQKLKNYRLTGLTLYVTVEPCPMCLGAILQARIKRLVYGTEDSKQGAVVSRLAIPLARANHRLEVCSGILSVECRQVISNFFRSKRESRKSGEGLQTQRT